MGAMILFVHKSLFRLAVGWFVGWLVGWGEGGVEAKPKKKKPPILITLLGEKGKGDMARGKGGEGKTLVHDFYLSPDPNQKKKIGWLACRRVLVFPQKTFTQGRKQYLFYHY